MFYLNSYFNLRFSRKSKKRIQENKGIPTNGKECVHRYRYNPNILYVFIPCIFLKFKLLVQICKLFIPLHIFRFYYCALPYLLILSKKFETKEHFKRKNNKMNIKGKI